MIARTSYHRKPPRYVRPEYGPHAFLAADVTCRVECGTPYPGAVALMQDRVPRQSRRSDRRRRARLIAPQHALAAIRAPQALLPDTTIITVRSVA